jgi:hypothetical protein
MSHSPTDHSILLREGRPKSTGSERGRKSLREFSAAKREAWKDVDFYKLAKEWKQLKEAKRSTF